MEYKIYTGSLISIKKGFMKGSLRIMFCGMPNDSTFAISPLLVRGYQGFSPTVYFSTSSRVIHLHDREFDVLEVNPDFIVLGD